MKHFTETTKTFNERERYGNLHYEYYVGLASEIEPCYKSIRHNMNNEIGSYASYAIFRKETVYALEIEINPENGHQFMRVITASDFMRMVLDGEIEEVKAK